MALRDHIDEVRRLRVEDGLTLQEIGDKYGVTREYVRQVLEREGVVERPQTRIRRCVICAYSPDKTVREIADEVGEDCSTVHQALRSHGLPYQHRTGGPGRLYTDEELLNSLRELGKKLDRTPTSKDVISASPPSHTLYYKHFGSLRNAQRLAGFKPNRRGHRRKRGRTQPEKGE